jgi:hypothetical protein
MYARKRGHYTAKLCWQRCVVSSTIQNDLISLAEARRQFGIGKAVLKKHLPIIDIGYRTKLVRRADVANFIDRMTVQPMTVQPSQQSQKPTEPRRGGGKRRDLLG